MKHLLVLMLIGCFVVAGGLLALAQDTETITITVRCRAKPPMEDWRGNNFLLAADELNADLEAAGDPRRVEVEINQDNIDWGDYVTEFVLSCGAGEAPDIWLTGHEYIGAQAEAGLIIALDQLMTEFPGFNNVIDNLWDSTSYKGEIWGVPQDAEARPLYFNKALLGELGWTADEIAALPDKIEKGEFTLYDMLVVAKDAVDKGVVEEGNGFWTRPRNGPDFTAFYYAFGGETIEAATGKLVFDVTAGLKYYQFFYDAAQTYGSMGGLGLCWDAWHSEVSGSKVLFWIGGTWHWPDWAESYLQELGGEDYMWETFGFGLIPAAGFGGRPNTLTYPLVYTISSQCEHPDLALALIDKVTDYGPNTRHAIASTHLGILKGQTEYKFYKDSRLLSEALYMLDYTTFLPNNPYWGRYSTITYEALAAVVGGEFTPQEAVDFVVEELLRELEDMVKIIRVLVTPVCLNAGVQIEIDDPTTASTDFRTVDFGIFRTLAPKVRITLQHPFPQDFQVIVDDGDDCTADDLTITSLYSVTGNVAEADIPEIIPIDSLPGLNQDVFRTLLDDPSSVRIFYFGENRIRFFAPAIGPCHSFLLNYEAFDETVVGVDDGIELFPEQVDIEIMKNHIIMDFDEEIVSDADISSVLLTEKLRPQGITRDLGVIQARPLDVLDAPSLLARIASINTAGHPGLQEARVDLVITEPTIGGELYPEAFKKDFQKATSDWKASVRQNQYHHFIIQTLPAHRLIDITKSVTATVRVYMPGSGVGNNDNFSGEEADKGNKFFVKGNRIKQPVKVLGRAAPDRNGRTATTDPDPVNNHKTDGDLRAIRNRSNHDSKVFGIIGGDGVGNKTGAGLNGDNVILGTGKDAEIRVVQWTSPRGGAFENAYYKQLEISAADSISKIHVIEMSYSTTTSALMTAQLKDNLKKKYKAVADSGKIIIGAAWNEGALPPDPANPGLGDVANTDVGRISPDRTSSRSSNTGNNAFKQRVLAVGASDRVLSPNVLEVKRGSSNKGEEIGVVAPGQEIRGTDRTGNLTNSSGTSFSTPIVVGIAAELMLVDTTLQQAANLPKVLEFIEATADDIGTAGRDNDTGFGRVNFWKAVLSAANGGLSKEGRTEAADDKGKDSFFKFLLLKDAAATKWYGFEVRVSTKNAVLWFGKNDGTFLKVEDAGAKRPALDSIAESVVTAFMSTQSHRNANKILPSLPFSSTELTNAGVKQWYLARFSMKKDQLANKTHLLAVKPGETPTTTAEGGDVILSLPLDLKEMRKASASSNQAIKKRVKEFDDFVFYISL